METLDLLKKNQSNMCNNEETDAFIKIIELNNRKIISLKLFCLYNNYNEKSSFYQKNKFPKKFYFNIWHKSLIIKKDE